jgi:GNAT superfamily N-acetyltransferase
MAVRRPRKARFGRRPEPPTPAGLAIAAPVHHDTSRSEGYLVLRRPMDAPVPPSPLPEGFTLAPITANDATAVHALLKAAYDDRFGTVPESPLTWWKDLVLDSEYDNSLAMTAKVDDEIVGFCLCWTSSFVKDIAVDARFRGHGLASALLARAIEALRKRGAEEVVLKVHVHNAIAQRLYRKFGFAQD